MDIDLHEPDNTPTLTTNTIPFSSAAAKECIISAPSGRHVRTNHDPVRDTDVQQQFSLPDDDTTSLVRGRQYE